MALSTQVPYDVVARWDDRVKATYWELLEETKDRAEG